MNKHLIKINNLSGQCRLKTLAVNLRGPPSPSLNYQGSVGRETLRQQGSLKTESPRQKVFHFLTVTLEALRSGSRRDHRVASLTGAACLSVHHPPPPPHPHYRSLWCHYAGHTAALVKRVRGASLLWALSCVLLLQFEQLIHLKYTSQDRALKHKPC